MNYEWTLIDWDKLSKKATVSNGSLCAHFQVPDEYLIDQTKFIQYVQDYCTLLEEELKESPHFDPSMLIGHKVGSS